MSRYDFDTFCAIANALRYQRLAATFAANSLKLQPCATTGNGSAYIWLDPPWQLVRHGRCFLESDSYPAPSRPGSRHEEKLWLQQARAGGFGRHYFLGAGLRSDGLVALRFSEGWTLLAPGWALDREDDRWYDDWYASTRHPRT